MSEESQQQEPRVTVEIPSQEDRNQIRDVEHRLTLLEERLQNLEARETVTESTARAAEIIAETAQDTAAEAAEQAQEAADLAVEAAVESTPEETPDPNMTPSQESNPPAETPPAEAEVLEVTEPAPGKRQKRRGWW